MSELRNNKRNGDKLRSRAARRPPPALDQPAPARVLIVDDDERNAFAATQALEGMGYELVVARSGEEALRRLLHDDYAVILLDLHMPGMDGYETAALIQARKRSRDVPIVFLTAVFRDEAHVFQAYNAGAVDVVFKPVDPFILRAKVAVLVELRMKTLEVERQAAHREWLLAENNRVLSEKQAAERALWRSQERIEAILNSLPVAVVSRAIEAPYPALFVSDSVERLTGFAPSRFVDEPEFGMSRVHPEDRERVARAIADAPQTGVYACEFRWLCADGNYRYLLDQGIVSAAREGEPRELFSTLIDSTERRSLEEQLAQARKMEAVGQLTGGVAHDFNNLLTVVLGNVDLLSRKVVGDEKQVRQLGAVRHAAERGRSLTRQLLAFSRRQHLSPVTLDVNQLIREFVPLMQQAVGEAVTIEAALPDPLLSAHVDPAQLETALLNLGVNARDAMPGGGRLEITTARVGAPEGADADVVQGHEGDWLRIEVKDDGEGMPREVMERVFEPFFTTKEVGKGSGLGLSQVYGFVRQSGGHVGVDSKVGEGTVFHLYLPATAAPVAPRKAKPQTEAPRGVERLLVVEDDPAVLALGVEMLTGLGYHVLTAPDAPTALEVLEGDEPIDLLFSDVVMPGGASGVQLARAAQELRPGIAVLLTSGYVGETAPFSNDEFMLIDKPYERAVLATKLRELLDERPAPKKTDRSRRAAGGSSATG